jgi:hypothetical protein
VTVRQPTLQLLRQPITWLVLLFIVLGSIYAVTTPLFEASDELWHYPMVQHLSKGGALPVQDPNNVGPWRQEASQPPLYYYLMGWATAWIDTSDMPQTRWLNPHVDNGIITPDGNTNLAVHTAAENFPWGNTVLAVRLVRLLSVLMSAGTVLFTYLLAREFFEDEISRLSAAGFVAFVPMFAFISGAVNNDNLSSLLSAILLFLLVHITRQQSLISNRQSIILGVLLGLAALTKQSALGLFPLVGITLVAISIKQAPLRFDRASLLGHFLFILRHSLLVFVTAFILAAWLYIRNIMLYGDLLGWSAFIAVLGKRAQEATLWQLWGERESFSRTYWGLFGGINVPMADWIYIVFNLIAIVAMLGLVFFFIRIIYKLIKQPAKPQSLREASNLQFSIPVWYPYAILLGQFALLVYGLITWATVTWSSQGRLVFSGIAAIAVLIVIGLRTLLPIGVRLWVLSGILLFMASVTLAAPFLFIIPAYQDPPALTEEKIASIPNQLDIDFGSVNFPPEMRLLGYSLETNDIHPGESLKLTLYWQALTIMDRDWSVFVHVLDENEIVVAQRDTFPGLGLMPTRKLAAGQTLADTYVLPLSSTTYSPSNARLEIGLYDYNSGDRLLVVSENIPDAGRDALTLAPLTITPVASGFPNPQSINFGGQIELVGYEMDKRVLKPGEILRLTLYWRGLKPVTTNYSVFAHVRGAGESLWGQYDSWPLDGAAPTSTWQVGEVVEDVRTITVKPETPPGVYDIEIGLYDETGLRLQLVLPDGRLTDNFVYLAKMRVSQ